MNELQLDFYNTNGEVGEALRKSRIRAGSQQEKIYRFLQRHNGDKFTPYRIHCLLFDENTPETSVRRALTNLTNMGMINKYNNMGMGRFGKLSHQWGIPEMISKRGS